MLSWHLLTATAMSAWRTTIDLLGAADSSSSTSDTSNSSTDGSRHAPASGVLNDPQPSSSSSKGTGKKKQKSAQKHGMASSPAATAIELDSPQSSSESLLDLAVHVKDGGMSVLAGLVPELSWGVAVQLSAWQ